MDNSSLEWAWSKYLPILLDTIRNIRGDKGHPCQIPLLGQNKSEVDPLIK